MAFVERPSISVTFTFEDETGSQTSTSGDLPLGTTYAEAETQAAALSFELLKVSDCALLGWSITKSTFDTSPLPAEAGSRVERKGVLALRTAAAKLARISVPGVKDDVVLPDGRIDDDHPDVASLAATLINGAWTDSNGVALTALHEAYERFSSTTRKQLPAARRPD